jgi:hypothetical protein
LPSLFSFGNKGVTHTKARRVELLLLFGIGIVLGITLKTFAVHSFTIGYLDYTVRRPSAPIDLNATEKQVLAHGSAPLGSQGDTAKACLQTR